MKLHTPTKKLVKQLIAKQDAPIVSIIMPTHPSSSPEHFQEDRSRFNNLARKALHQLEDQNYNHEIVESMRQRLYVVHEDFDFWRNQADGLALYMNTHDEYAFKLPRQPKEHVVVEGVYHIAPLFVASQLNKKFLIYQPSYKDPQLYKADWYDMEPADVDLPHSIKEALRIDEYETDQQYNVVASPGGGSRGSAMFHGHGGSEDAKDSERFNYHKVLDDIVAPLANKSKRTVILAGPSEEVSAYKSRSKIKNIAEPTLEGNIQAHSKEKLHRRVREIISHLNEKEQEDMAQKLYQKNVLFDPDKIIQAISQGRVSSLFIGVIDKTSDHVAEHTDKKSMFQHPIKDTDLDMSIIRALHYSGEVFGLKQSLIPHGGAMAALLRY